MGKKESEKLIERKLKREVEKLGGYCFKMVTIHISGLPDRLCLFPGGRIAFVETKSTRDNPSAIQRVWHRKLRRIGFLVEIIDQSYQIDELINKFKN